MLKGQTQKRTRTLLGAISFCRGAALAYLQKKVGFPRMQKIVVSWGVNFLCGGAETMEKRGQKIARNIC